MSNNYGASQYKKTSVVTADRGRILLMLYEAAIQNTKKAIVAMEKKDIPGKGMLIGKIHDIINELQNSLNFEVGGEIAHDLERLYCFMTEQLVKANFENDAEPLRAIQKLLENLLDGWRKAVAQFNTEKI